MVIVGLAIAVFLPRGCNVERVDWAEPEDGGVSMKRMIAASLVIGTLALGLAGCGETPGTRAVTGGLMGAGAGAGVSALTGGRPATGALIGGGVGAVGGAVTGR
jgi:hypothetical protein